VLALLERAGDFCSADVWHRVVQLVTNNEGSQSYAAEQVMEVLQRGASHEALVCLAAYVLGEYGKLIRVGCLCRPVVLACLGCVWQAGV
jgi:AP-2 complex subunit alpha